MLLGQYKTLCGAWFLGILMLPYRVPSPRSTIALYCGTSYELTKTHVLLWFPDSSPREPSKGTTRLCDEYRRKK